MSRIWALATNTFREAVRDRILYSILFFAFGVLVLSLAMQEVTIGDQAKVVRSVAQGAVDAFGSIIAMFLGISLVYKEIERKTVYTILSKPIARWKFVLGKYTGLVLTLWVEVLALTVLYTVLMTLQQRFPPPVLFVSMGTLMLELMLLTAWATLFSTFSTPTTAAAFTLAIFIIGHLADDIWLFGNQADSATVRQAARALYWALPNFELFSLRVEAVHEREVPWGRVGLALAYGAAYTSAVLTLAIAVFRNRDLK
ncbi:ABC transporter permease [Myxococcota bacterium]|nr:ABC transporter permease [Myxococcota bacterium]